VELLSVAFNRDLATENGEEEVESKKSASRFDLDLAVERDERIQPL
jgi:hypothetical protein